MWGIYSSVARALNSVSDAAVMDVCRNCPKPHGYSYDRVRGILSLGMGLSNICCGAILAYSSFRDYQVWFVCTCALFIVAALVFPLSSIWVKNFKNSLCGNALSGNGNGDADEASSGSDSEDIKPKDNGDATVCFKMWKLISNIQVLFFLLVSIVNGMGNATYDIYIILRLKQLNASYVLIGFTAGLGSLTNFAFFYITPMIRKKIGNRGMIIVSMLTFCVRSGIYSLINNSNYLIVLIAQSLHGLNFSVMLAGSIGYLNEKTKTNGLTIFGRSMFAFAFSGLGGVVGNLLGGYLYDIYGAVLMFQVKVYVTLCAAVLFFLSEFICSPSSSSYTPCNNNDEQVKK